MEATESPEIPKEYHDLTEVFSKSKSEELPPHRGSLDHSIPLISGLLHQLKGAKYFIKLDVREAFNRLRIALGDEHKTAF